MSVHQIGFQEVLLAADLRGRLPKEMVMFGVQPASLELNVGLSETVKEKIPELTASVVEQVQKWSDNSEQG